MSKIIVLLVASVFSVAAFAKDSKGSSKKAGGTVTPFLYHESGTYKFEDGVDNGDYSAVGVGLRGGGYWGPFYLGAETAASTPSYKNGKELSTSVRQEHYLANSYGTNLGATLALKLGPVRISGTIYIDSQLHGFMDTGNAATPKANYTYYGSGSRLAFEMNVFKGLTLGAGMASYTYDKYSISQTLGSVEEASRAERSKFTLKATSISVNYEIPFGG